MSEFRFVRMGFGADMVDYQVAWDEQRRVHAARFADEVPDTCLLLEHPPVYTAGRRTAPEERPLDGTPVIDVDRGGKITWHGPGQLVGYPIQKLPRPVDVVAHLRRLEDAMIAVCAEFGIEAARVEGRAGVWVLGDPIEQRTANKEHSGLSSTSIPASAARTRSSTTGSSAPSTRHRTRASGTRTARSAPWASASPRASRCTASR